MSRNVDIFIAKDRADLHEFAVEISRVLGVPLEFKRDETYGDESYDSDDGLLSLHEHGFEDDVELEFEKYRFRIRVYLRGEFLNQAIAKVFETLKAKTFYPLLVIEDIDVILDRRD